MHHNRTRANFSGNTQANVSRPTAAVVSGGVKAPQGLPVDCSAGSCSLCNLNRIKAPETWAALGPLMPFVEIKKTAMIIDDGINPTHNDLKNQIDRVNSVTFSDYTNNQPAKGVEALKANHDSHVSGVAAGGGVVTPAALPASLVQ
uniref:Peptidase S8/S53 domain-containing protein n=1 Tax=Tetradesmus obliquus TaxID=3088 RepID=A0A383V5N2_TETOB|eukprot:jgi/Sobl393_1/14949/SZX60411.1